MSWRSFYDDLFADTFLDAVEAEGASDAAVIERLTGLPPGARVLDQGCGTGRIARALAGRGHRVVAVDGTAAYADRGRAADPRGEVTWAVDDIERFVADLPCDAVVSWHTSFGYGDDTSAAAVLDCARRSLRPRGRFLLDVGNFELLVGDFKPEWRSELATSRGPVEVRRRSTWDGPVDGPGWLAQEWTFFLPDGREATRSATVRVFPKRALIDLCAAAGLRVVDTFGDHAGGPWTPIAPRCMLLASREDQ